MASPILHFNQTYPFNPVSDTVTYSWMRFLFVEDVDKIFTFRYHHIKLNEDNEENNNDDDDNDDDDDVDKISTYSYHRKKVKTMMMTARMRMTTMMLIMMLTKYLPIVDTI